MRTNISTLLWGLLAFLPITLLVLGIIYVLGTGPLPNYKTLNSPFYFAYLSMLLISTVIWCLFMLHAASNNSLYAKKRLRWILWLFLFSIFSYPFYWHRYIKNAYPYEYIPTGNNRKEFLKARKKQSARTKVRLKELAKEQKPIFRELKNAGLNIKSLWSIPITKENHKTVIPILIKHLNLKYSKSTRDSIARSLAIDWLNDVNLIDELFNQLEHEENDDLKWVIGLTLSSLIKPKLVSHTKYTEKIHNILHSDKYGSGRSELVLVYAQFINEKAIPELIEFMQKRDMMQSSIHELGRLRAVEAKPHLERIIEEQESFMREKARIAIKKIDKYGEKK